MTPLPDQADHHLFAYRGMIVEIASQRLCGLAATPQSQMYCLRHIFTGMEIPGVRWSEFEVLAENVVLLDTRRPLFAQPSGGAA